MKKIYKIVAGLMLAISANQSFGYVIWDEDISTAAYLKADCDTYIAPFIETFSTGSLPLCWTNTSSNTVANGLWKFSGAVDYAPGNSRPNGTFAWADGSDPSNISDVTLTSPWIDVAALTAPTLFFDYFSNNLNTYPNNIIKVEVREQAGAWAPIYTDNASSNEWRELEVPLPALTGTEVQVRFIFDKTAAPTGWVFYNGCQCKLSRQQPHGRGSPDGHGHHRRPQLRNTGTNGPPYRRTSDTDAGLPRIGTESLWRHRFRGWCDGQQRGAA